MPCLVLEVYDDPQPKLTMRTEIGRRVPQAWATDLLKLESSVYGFDPHTIPCSSGPQTMVMEDAVKSRSFASCPQTFGATGGGGGEGGGGEGGGGEGGGEGGEGGEGLGDGGGGGLGGSEDDHGHRICVALQNAP